MVSCQSRLRHPGFWSCVRGAAAQRGDWCSISPGPRWCNGTTGCATPSSLAQCHPTWPNGTRGTYAFGDAGLNFRALRVINGSADFLFVQVDRSFSFAAPADALWSEYYDLRGGGGGGAGGDAWQRHNLWGTLAPAQKRALQRWWTRAF